MKKNILALAILSAIATPALADNSGSFYGAVDYGTLSLKNANPGGTDFANPGVLRISAGYHFSPMLGVEAGYAIVGNSTLIDALGSITAKGSAFQVAAVGTYPINDSFELFGKLGFSMNSNKLSGTGTYAALNTSNSNTDLMYGIGAQFNINKQFGIRAQYEDFGKNTYSSNLTNLTWKGKVSMTSIGVVYNF